jgi:hypothetical protein
MTNLMEFVLGGSPVVFSLSVLAHPGPRRRGCRLELQAQRPVGIAGDHLGRPMERRIRRLGGCHPGAGE